MESVLKLIIKKNNLFKMKFKLLEIRPVNKGVKRGKKGKNQGKLQYVLFYS